MSRFGDVFACPLCHKQVTPPHVKRHLRAHDRRLELGHLAPSEAAQLRAASDLAWVRWLEHREEIDHDSADAIARRIEDGHKVPR